MHVVGRRARHDNLMRRWVDAQMHLPPGPSLRIAVLAHFPFSFTKQFEPSRIDHQMQWLPRRVDAAGPAHGKCGPSPRQRRVAWHGHINAQQRDEGLHKPLRLSQREAIHSLHRQHALHRQMTIGLWGTPPSRGGGDPVLHGGGITPHSQASALPEAVGIFRPVADTIAVRRIFLVLHTSRYSCPRSYPQLLCTPFMQQSLSYLYTTRQNTKEKVSVRHVSRGR